MLRRFDPSRRDPDAHDLFRGRHVKTFERFDERDRRRLEREPLGLDQNARIRGSDTPRSLAQLDQPAPVTAYASHTSPTPPASFAAISARLWGALRGTANVEPGGHAEAAAVHATGSWDTIQLPSPETHAARCVSSHPAATKRPSERCSAQAPAASVDGSPGAQLHTSDAIRGSSGDS
jgi:hypothetical protein